MRKRIANFAWLLFKITTALIIVCHVVLMFVILFDLFDGALLETIPMIMVSLIVAIAIEACIFAIGSL